MGHEIIINLFKLVNKFFPTFFKKKINQFHLIRAKKTINNFKKIKNKNISAREIKKILFFSGIKLDIKNEDFYLKLLDLILDRGNLKTKFFLIKQLKSLNCNSMSFKIWLRLRDIFYLKLEMVLGGICRKKAIKYALTNNKDLFLTKKDQGKAMLEYALNLNKNNKNYFEQLFFKKKLDKKILGKFLSIIYKTKLNTNIIKKTYVDKKFIGFLNKKKIAIVGPAETNSKDAIEIDSYDTVIRFNYLNSNKNLDQFKKGLKVDISYFSNQDIDYLIKKNKGKLPDDLKVACIRNNNFNRVEKLEKANPDKIIRQIDNYNILNFYSSFNLLPLVLFDILQCDIKIIKVFHSDQYLTENNNPKYDNTTKLNAIPNVIKGSFLNHDPMSQHRFLKKIYQCNKIIGDTKFEKVMRLDTFKYLKELESLYSIYK